ncbi:MAG: amino acid ABC transporter permease [Anaerolineales bacterium]|nr:MAG: amino acid ABC transporter permease [Anaerolineales bacterium]
MTVISDEVAPPAPPGPLKWLRDNLFSTWYNSLLTILGGTVVYFIVVSVVSWVFTQADWRPVTVAPLLYLVGQYPRAELWRAGLSLWIFTFLIGMSWGVWKRYLRIFSIFLVVMFAVLAVFPLETPTITPAIRIAMGINSILILLGYRIGRMRVVNGKLVAALWLAALLLVPLVILSGFPGSSVLPKVATAVWGGLLITLLLSVGGIVLSFPIGVLLALGRRSSLPVVKWFSIGFIEIVRGVPLVTILFMFSIILALFLPTEARIDQVIRALIGIVIFSAAYMAENIRGGLQAIPPGQIEAAKALGLRSFHITFLIVLPQALRLVIPTIVGQFITLFKDTTLVYIVGINDLLGIGNAILNSNPAFVRLQMEVYLFIAVIFWIFSYFMSYASLQLEKALGVGER